MSAMTNSFQRSPSGVLPPPSPDVVAKSLGISKLSIEWLAGDGSDRCYYRIRSSEILGSHVLMQLSGSDAQALKDNGYDWIHVADLLSKRGICIPKVIVALPESAALIIEDYGNDMLESVVYRHAKEGNFEAIRHLYQASFQILARLLLIHSDEKQCWNTRQFDHERYLWELNFFFNQFFRTQEQKAFMSEHRLELEKEASALSFALSPLSSYFCHRDFHSRNILKLKDKLAIIDFQDARLGAAAYDLVSLCFDSYVPFEAPFRDQLLKDGIKTLSAICGSQVGEEIEASWKAVLLQRQLKAIGSFAFLTYEKKRGNYMNYVPHAVRTLTEANLEDDRWPLLSGLLLQHIEDTVELA